MIIEIESKRILATNWWPVSDEEWERLNYPEKFNKPKKDPNPVDNNKE